MEDREEKKEQANRLFAKFHNLIEDIGGDLGQELMVSILAKECALIAVDELLDIASESYDIDHINWWKEVKQEIEKL